MMPKRSVNLDCARLKIPTSGITLWRTAIITKDQDFAERLPSSRNAPVIVWLRIGNTSKRALVDWLRPLWPDIISRIESGDMLVEVREKRPFAA